MCSPQLRHRPRSMSQERTGTLSWAAICAPQDGQCERPATKPSPRGIRWAITVTKLPTRRPAGNAIRAGIIYSKASGSEFLPPSHRRDGFAPLGVQAEDLVGLQLEAALEPHRVVHELQPLAGVRAALPHHE